MERNLETRLKDSDKKKKGCMAMPFPANEKEEWAFSTRGKTPTYMVSFQTHILLSQHLTTPTEGGSR